MYMYFTLAPEKIQFFLQRLLFGVHKQKQHHNMPALFCNWTILGSKQYTSYKVLKLIMQRNHLINKCITNLLIIVWKSLKST